MRTTMRTTFAIAMFALTLAAVPASAEERSGVVEAADATRVTVSGQTYAIDGDTELVDRGGARVSPHELVPGTPAELDLDDNGRLLLLRATLIR